MRQIVDPGLNRKSREASHQRPAIQEELQSSGLFSNQIFLDININNTPRHIDETSASAKKTCTKNADVNIAKIEKSILVLVTI